MRDKENVLQVAELAPDFMGFIFYDGSKRNITETQPDFLNTLDERIRKVGVFVNEKNERIIELSKQYGFTMVQLHGDEDPDYCSAIKQQGLEVMKAFSIDDSFNFESTQPYKNLVDYFLFDTKGANYGGNGVAFDWDLLKQYDNEVPFFLSGGVDERVLDELELFNELNIIGVDVNSKFETAPGVKDVARLKEFISKIRQ